MSDDEFECCVICKYHEENLRRIFNMFPDNIIENVSMFNGCKKCDKMREYDETINEIMEIKKRKGKRGKMNMTERCDRLFKLDAKTIRLEREIEEIADEYHFLNW